MHQHTHNSSSTRIGWAFVLNLSFTIIEFIGGLLTNSTAILADAVHDLGDSLAIGSAWILDRLSLKDPDLNFTYGYRRLSLFGALLNGIVLIVGSIWVLMQAIPRLLDPVMPQVQGMLGLAILGVVINGFAAYKLSAGKSHNERMLNWHLLEDVLGWLAVLVVSVTLMFVDWPILDPLLAIIFTLFILSNVIRHFRSTVKLFFQGVPEAELVEQIHEEISQLELIREIHHEHCWSLDGEHHVYTAHLLLDRQIDPQQLVSLKARIADTLAKFNLAHTTIEIEYPEEECRDGNQPLPPRQTPL